MILDAMTYSVMTVVLVLSFTIIRLTWPPKGQQDNSDKE
jgi:hypothetical protein